VLQLALAVLMIFQTEIALVPDVAIVGICIDPVCEEGAMGNIDELSPCQGRVGVLDAAGAPAAVEHG
jgi:hypothetical protein